MPSTPSRCKIPGVHPTNAVLDRVLREMHNLHTSSTHPWFLPLFTMPIARPDLSQADPAILDYVETLEAELARLHALQDLSGERQRQARREPEQPLEPSEPPTTLNVVTISAGGMVKRTPRHLYQRQRRGGMGVFDLETPANDRPAFLALADAASSLLLLTNRGRAFRLPLSSLAEASVRSRGQVLGDFLGFMADERVICALPAEGGSYLVLVSERGQVRRYSAHLFSEAMRPGAAVFDPAYGGEPAAACWTAGDDDLFIATRSALAIRFAERQVPVRGVLGIRLERDDRVAAVTAVKDDSSVFLLGADGRGARRQMAGFRPHKEPGAGGKTAMKTDALIGAVTVGADDELFILSRLSKIIRFYALDVPAKEGVVQGVDCMELRADETVAVIASRA